MSDRDFYCYLQDQLQPWHIRASHVYLADGYLFFLSAQNAVVVEFARVAQILNTRGVRVEVNATP